MTEKFNALKEEMKSMAGQTLTVRVDLKLWIHPRTAFGPKFGPTNSIMDEFRRTSYTFADFWLAKNRI